MYLFLRGSFGAYYGVQFASVYTFKWDDPFNIDNLDLSGSVARGVFGLSIEFGGGGKFNFTWLLWDANGNEYS